MQRNWNPVNHWWEWKNGVATTENSMAVPQKIKNTIPVSSRKFYPWVYTQNNWKYSLKYIFYIHVCCIAALFTIAKMCKQPKSPLIEGWINKMWYTYIMEYYSVLKREEILTHATTQVKFDDIMLSETSYIPK